MWLLCWICCWWFTRWRSMLTFFLFVASGFILVLLISSGFSLVNWIGCVSVVYPSVSCSIPTNQNTCLVAVLSYLYAFFVFLVLFHRMYALHKSMNVGDPTFTKDDMIKIVYISERQRMIISLVFFGVELRLNPKF